MKKIILVVFMFMSSFAFAESDSVFLDLAKLQNINFCAPQMKKIEQILFDGTDYSVKLVSSKNDTANKVLAFNVVSKNGSYLNNTLITLKKNSDGTCDLAYQHVWFEPSSCSKVTASAPDIKLEAINLNDVVTGRRESTGAEYRFAPVLTGCQVAQSEVIYRWK